MIRQKGNYYLLVGLMTIVGSSCISSNSHLSYRLDEIGGALGAPTTTTADIGAGNSTLSSSESYTTWVSTSTTSFPGSGGLLESENYQMSNAMLELGVVQVHEEAK